MPKTLRFGVAMEEGLLVRFDRLIREQKYTNRSEALRDLVRRELVSREWEEERPVAGAITFPVVGYRFHHPVISNGGQGDPARVRIPDPLHPAHPSGPSPLSGNHRREGLLPRRPAPLRTPEGRQRGQARNAQHVVHGEGAGVRAVDRSPQTADSRP